MLRKSSVKNKFILAVLLASIIPFSVGAWYIQKIITDQEKQSFRIHSYEALSRIHSIVNDGSIKPANKIISLLAMDNKSIELANILQRQQIAKPDDIDQQYYSHFTNYKKLFPNIIGIGLGTEQGGYIEYPSFFTEPGYDPRTRPWYQGALQNPGQAYLNDPYVMQTTGEMVISIAHTIETNGQIAGVLVTGWNINELQKEVEELKLSLSGYVILINQNDKIITSHKHPGWLMKTPQETGVPELDHLIDGELNQIIIDGKPQLAFCYTSVTSGWRAIAIIEEAELQKNVNKVLIPVVLAYCVAILAILVSIFLIAQIYVIRPIKALSAEAVAIAGNNLDARVVINNNDEFGMLATTFNEMAQKLKMNFNKIHTQNLVLFKREKELQTLVENAQDIILRVDKNRIITYLNAVFESYAAQPAKNLIGQPLGTTRMPECFLTAVEEIFAKERSDYGNTILDFEFTTSSQQVKNFQAHLIPEFYEHEYPETVLAVIRDVTQQKQIEKQLARMDRLNVIGEMAAGLAHEIRNPMTTVRGFLQMIGKKEPNSPYAAFYTLMIEELDRTNAIITEFLSLAKNKTVNLKASNLNAVIEALAPLIQANANLSNMSLHLELQEIPNVLIDDKEIRQLILNLVRNALDAMTANGIVTIRTCTAPNSVVLTIQDQGQGIAPRILENIGMPFLTTRDSGTGLGLAVCYSIAARHNAKISVQTGPAGTEFAIQFPVPAND